MDVTCLEREGLGPSWTVVNISSVYIHFRTLLGCTAVLWWGAIPGRLCWVVTFVDLQCHGGIHGWVSLLGVIAGCHCWAPWLDCGFWPHCAHGRIKSHGSGPLSYTFALFWKICSLVIVHTHVACMLKALLRQHLFSSG